MNNVFCPNCGQPVQPGTVYCSNCGQRITSASWQTPQVKKESSTNTILIVLLSVLIGLLVAGGIFYLVRSQTREDKPANTQPAEATPPQKDTVVVVQQVQTPAAPAATRTQIIRTPPANPTQVVVTGNNVRLRLSPYINPRNPNDNTLTYNNGANVHPRKGEALRYLGEAGDFYYVEYRGYTCYISKQFSYLR